MLNKLKRAALGAHTPHDKATAASKPVPMPLPAQVRILMSQHIGAPAKALVKKGDEVFVGTKIGEAGGFVSANIHSSVSGTVAAVEPFRLSNGRMCDSVVIKTDGKQTVDPAVKAPEVTDKASFLKAVRECGLVGLGGAGFPTDVKLQPKQQVDTLLINASECEVWLTSDTQEMLNCSDDIIAAVQHLLRIAGQPHFALGSVDQQGIHLLLGLQLYVGREACAAQTDQTALTHSLEEAGLIGHFRCLDSRVHGLFAIGLDDDRVAHAAIGQTEGLHCGNRAGDTGVDVCRDEAASLADLGANEHLVALFDQSFGGSADMLAHEDAYLRGQRHRDRFACSSCLVMRRMRAKRRTFQLVQHGIKSPILLELPPPRPCRRTGTGAAAA